MSSETTLLDDFRDFLRLLDDHDVEYLVVGGHAAVIFQRKTEYRFIHTC